MLTPAIRTATRSEDQFISSTRYANRDGFTLVELLVVISLKKRGLDVTMTETIGMHSVLIALFVGLAFNVLPALGMDDHRVEMKIDKHIQILPLGGLAGMTHLVAAPDGTIYLNTQSPDPDRALLKSVDGGRSWTAVPVRFADPGVWLSQTISGFTVTRDGQLWAVHQPGDINHGGVDRKVEKPWPKEKIKPLWVSRSSDGGRSWTSAKMDVGPHVPPGGRKAPYVKAMADYVSLIELSDGTVMFPVNMFYQDHDPSHRPFVMIRTRDGGETWGDPTFVREIEVKSRKYQIGATETDFAVDPKDPDRILAMSRKQRPLVPGEAENRGEIYKQALAPDSWPYPFKGSQLLESTDGGRTFEEVPNAYTGFYGHRGTICWTDRDVVIATYMFDPNLPQGTRATAGPKALHVAAAISLDGGQTWVDGTKTGTPNLDEAKRFVVNSKYGGSAPTIEVAPNRYLTAYNTYPGGSEGTIEGFFWHLDDASGNLLSLPLVKPRADAPVAEPVADKARRSAIHRRRRVIFNNDGDDLTDTPAPATSEGFLSRRMAHVADTGVDSVFYWHIGPTPLYSNVNRTARNAELKKLGTDSLKLAIETCRKHDIEIFWTYRLNDIHDSDGGISNWKTEHRHLLMGQPEDQKKYPESDPRWFWTFVDYAQREVRDLNLTVVRNVLNEYDVDGIDLDFLRHPAFFKETLLFKPATKQHLDMLTDMVRGIRKEVLAAGKRRGKPILLSVRILPTLALNNHFGFDVQRWLKEGTIDLITIGGGYDPFTVTVEGKEMIDFGHAHDIPVYVCLSRSGLRNLAGTQPWVMGTHASADTIEAWRAAAANAWHAGADGITTFNLFPDRFGPDAVKYARSIWSDISDPNTLVGKDKTYRIGSPPQAAFNCGSVPVEGRLPVTVRAGKGVKLVLPVADDIPALKNRIQNLRLRIVLSGLQASDVMQVHMNGKPIEVSAENPGWLDADVAPSIMKQGLNILTVDYQVGQRESLVINQIQLEIQYKG